MNRNCWHLWWKKCFTAKLQNTQDCCLISQNCKNFKNVFSSGSLLLASELNKRCLSVSGSVCALQFTLDSPIKFSQSTNWYTRNSGRSIFSKPVRTVYLNDSDDLHLAGETTTHGPLVRSLRLFSPTKIKHKCSASGLSKAFINKS